MYDYDYAIKIWQYCDVKSNKKLSNEKLSFRLIHENPHTDIFKQKTNTQNIESVIV